LIKLDHTLNEEELYETLTVLDEDGSGDISKKEFLNAFGQIDNAQEEETQKAEQQLQDDMWPEWVFRD
jgi:Ca2+-binding EF-hand superfamily protein